MRAAWLVVLLVVSCVVQPSNPPPTRYGGGPGGGGGAYTGGGNPGVPGAPPNAYPGGGGSGPSCGAGNLALGKAARQSSQSSWSKLNDAQGGIDGQKTGGFGFHTAEESQPWWEVDLGQPCGLGQIVIYNRLDCCGERANTLQVSISSGNGDWQVIYTHPGSAFGGVKDGRPLVVDAGGRTARVVRISLTGRAYLHFDEVEIFGAGQSGGAGSPPPPPVPPVGPPSPPAQPTLASCGPGNIALDRPARQSSTSGWSKTNDAQGAVDGQKNGGFGFHTGTESQPWWEVDLGRTCPVGRLTIYNRLDCCGERARTLQVLVSSGDGTWTVAYKHDGSTFGGIKDGRPLVVDLGGRAARIVRIQLTSNDYLHFDEVELESR